MSNYLYRLLLVILCTCSLPVHGANWAQVSGTRYTNAVALDKTPWRARHGHSAVALDFSDEYIEETGKLGRLFVVGGDSSVQGDQDLRAYPGGGSLRNDVWATTGITWSIQTSPLKTTKWGDPLPRTIANMTWLQTNPGKRPPRGITYPEWIACAFAPWAQFPPKGCEDPSKPPGAYLADNMFSPRRNFATVAFNKEIYVIGGRAREHIPLPQTDLRGGVTGWQVNMSTEAKVANLSRNVRWREYTVLKNDVWKSKDAGASWTLVTPGCFMPQANLVHKAGDRFFQCIDDDQCEGDASCQFASASASLGVCICKMWSPREFHAVAIHDNAFYLTGGYAAVQLGNCGVEEWARTREPGEEFACGGGYRAYMNDVWKSTDGEHWKLLKLEAPFAPRGEHTLSSFRSSMYLMGGRTGISKSTNGNSETEALLNDMWVSENGIDWSEVTDAVPWSKRAKHTVLVLPGSTDPSSGEDVEDQLLLFFGENEEQALGDVWMWKGEGSNWNQDYSADTEVAKYVTPSSSIHFLRGITSTHVATLQSVGLNRIEQLTDIDFDLTIKLRNFMPICDYIALARVILKTCTVTTDVYEGQEYADIELVQGKSGTAAKTDANTDEMTEDNWDGCTHLGAQYLDPNTNRWVWPDVKGIDQVDTLRDIYDDAQETICRWHPVSRTGHAAAIFKRKVFVFGGLTAPDYYENDVWYRIDRRPQAQFVTVPRPSSSDTTFTFRSDAEGVVFEYHVLNIVEQLVVRNWTKVLDTVDFESWLDQGTYRFRVRAVDPAGNVDATFEAGRNEYEWTYVPKLPWGLIMGLLSFVLVIIMGVIMEIRKRRKRAAMERYAMKRMRRKLKGKKKGAETDPNWRETYDKAKDKKAVKKRTKLIGGKKVAATKKKKEDKVDKKKDKKDKKDKKEEKKKVDKKKADDKGKKKKKEEKVKSEKTKKETKDKKPSSKVKPTKESKSKKKEEKVKASTKKPASPKKKGTK